MTITAFPLSWPPSWKRTDSSYRQGGRFGERKKAAGNSYVSLQPITIAEAAKRLVLQLEMMGVSRDTIIISTNLKTRQDGLPRGDQGNPRDPGAAVYWNEPKDDAPRTMAIDQYEHVAQNLAALAATIEAMRAIERHGGAVVMEKAFTGFIALPAPIITEAPKKHWTEVLGIPRNARVAEARAAFKRLVSIHHPDKETGNTAAFQALKQAYEDYSKGVGL